MLLSEARELVPEPSVQLTEHRTLRFLAICSALTYRDGILWVPSPLWRYVPGLDELLQRKTGLTLFRIIEREETDMFGFVAYSVTKQTIVVALRGSRSFLNWINNFRMNGAEVVDWTEPIGSTPVLVHSGFLLSFESIRAEIVEGILKAKLLVGDTPRILFTGHSMGGAIASMFALHWKLHNDDLIQVATFGSPRVGDASFAARFNEIFSSESEESDSIRVVNKKDMAPHVPFYNVPRTVAYRHSGRELWIRSVEHGGEYWSKPPTDEVLEDPYGSISIHITQCSILDHASVWDIQFGRIIW